MISGDFRSRTLDDGNQVEESKNKRAIKISSSNAPHWTSVRLDHELDSLRAVRRLFDDRAGIGDSPVAWTISSSIENMNWCRRQAAPNAVPPLLEEGRPMSGTGKPARNSFFTVF